jgi:hypothetical protein
VCTVGFIYYSCLSKEPEKNLNNLIMKDTEYLWHERGGDGGYMVRQSYRLREFVWTEDAGWTAYFSAGEILYGFMWVKVDCF